MNLINVPVELLRIGRPLPVPLRDAAGRLLLSRGAQIENTEQLQRLIEHGLHVDAREYDDLQRAWVQSVGHMVRKGASIGRIADALRDAESAQNESAAAETLEVSRTTDVVHLCSAMEMRLRNTLRDPMATDFLERLERDRRDIERVMTDRPDDVMVVLFHQAGREYRNYAVHHSLLVTCLCTLVALEHGGIWSDERRRALSKAAMTMNLSILGLQDILATHTGPLSPEHREMLDGHGLRSAQTLRSVGVSDEDWLQAVSLHHDVLLTDARELREATGMMRLIRKADVFCARLSPRRNRAALSATMAARAAFLDEAGQTDLAGSLLVKALGLYPPGTLVTLRNQEVGIVRRRGVRPGEPFVVSLIGASGMPFEEPPLRDTSQDNWKVAKAVTPAEAKVSVRLSAVLAR